MTLADEALAALAARGWSVATAESLTGGALCAAMVAVPGASASVRGGVVAYTAEVKSALLGVDSRLLGSAGLVSEAVAAAMAHGARAATGADVAVATTGAAGPDSHDGVAPGTVCLAVAGPAGARTRTVLLGGDRDAVRAGAVAAGLSLLIEVCRES